MKKLLVILVVGMLIAACSEVSNVSVKEVCNLTITSGPMLTHWNEPVRADGYTARLTVETEEAWTHEHWEVGEGKDWETSQRMDAQVGSANAALARVFQVGMVPAPEVTKTPGWMYKIGEGECGMSYLLTYSADGVSSNGSDYYTSYTPSAEVVYVSSFVPAGEELTVAASSSSVEYSVPTMYFDSLVRAGVEGDEAKLAELTRLAAEYVVGDGNVSGGLRNEQFVDSLLAARDGGSRIAKFTFGRDDSLAHVEELKRVLMRAIEVNAYLAGRPVTVVVFGETVDQEYVAALISVSGGSVEASGWTILGTGSWGAEGVMPEVEGSYRVSVVRLLTGDVYLK